MASTWRRRLKKKMGRGRCSYSLHIVHVKGHLQHCQYWTVISTIDAGIKAVKAMHTVEDFVSNLHRNSLKQRSVGFYFHKQDTTVIVTSYDNCMLHSCVI